MLWHAYVDETEDRGWARRPPGTPIGVRAGSSEHFSLGAIVVPDGYQTHVLGGWDRLRVEIGRDPGDVIHWINVKSHGQRLHLSDMKPIQAADLAIAVVALVPGRGCP